MTNPRRGRPKKEVIEILKPLDEKQINDLIHAVVSATLLRQENIMLKVSYLTEFADDFPIGVLKRKEGLFDYRKVKTIKVFKWLNKHGYFSTTPIDLRNALISQSSKYKEMFNP